MKEYRIRLKKESGEIVTAPNYNGKWENRVYSNIEDARKYIMVLLEQWETYKNRKDNKDRADLQKKPNLVIVSREVTEWAEEK